MAGIDNLIYKKKEATMANFGGEILTRGAQVVEFKTGTRSAYGIEAYPCSKDSGAID